MSLYRPLIALLIFLPALAWAQDNTIVRYNLRTRFTDTLRAVPVPPGRQSSGHSFGTLGRQADLPLSAPSPPFVPGTTFAPRRPAAQAFDVLTYPARTNVKLFLYQQGQRLHHCTGTLVGERYVLTAAHCLTSPTNFSEFLTDSILVVPAYDHGRDAGLPTAYGFRYYVFKTWHDGVFDDVGLIELSRPIGQAVGWVSLAAEVNPVDYQRQQWHKFSYPARDWITNPNRYNGDTLYYERGPVVADDRLMGVPGHFDCGSGQSGSSFLATDNLSYWEAHGVLSVAGDFTHARVTPSYLAAFRRIITQAGPLAASAATGDLANAQLFPNPASTELTIKLQPTTRLPLTIRFYDALGRLVLTRTHQQAEALSISLAGLHPGMYLVHLEANGQGVVRKLNKVDP